MFRPLYEAKMARAYSEMNVMTIAPRIGPGTVPMPPMTTTRQIIVDLSSGSSVYGST